MTPLGFRRCLVTGLAGCLAVAGFGASALLQDGGPPTAAPRTDAPGAVSPGASPVGPALSFAAADQSARTLPRLRSLLVSWRGDLVFEAYYNGARRDRASNVKSASKSVISTLVGIALERGLIAGPDTPIVTYFPELTRDPDTAKRAITVEDLLTMRSGLEGTSNRNYGAWVLSRNWVQHALSRPMFAPPGEMMEYSTGNTHLLSAILTKASGQTTWQFANEALGKPLGFTFAQWPRDPQGIYFGGNEMLMTPRQMLALGELYLNGGRSNGAQVVPEPWVRQSCVGRARSRSPFNDDDRRYGYGWWVRDFAGYETCFAWGYGGQYIFVVPAVDLVVVTTSASDVSDERRGHRRTLFDILERLVIAPLASSPAASESSP
jgi:CubicO group peptidase (beta-lactamase class C family)